VSDIAREQGDAAGARTALGDALKDLTTARASADAEDRAKVERVLSRVLDRFGETQPAQRALDRAFEAAPRDKDQAALTVGQMVGRAFVRGDITQARDGLKRGIAADLDNEDLVYYALWVRLLEKQLHIPSDGAPDRVFTTVPDDGRWIAKLALFGNAKMKAEDLVSAAKTPAQKTEALFYEAMDKRAAGDAKSADDFLRQVVAGPGVQLQEVAMARDILSGPKAQLGGPLPSGVAIP
jgi:tetratricopeptide (TPR) repeat protein